MHLKNGKKLYNKRGITFFHETERYVNNLNIYNRSKNGTNLWDDLIHAYLHDIHVTCATKSLRNILNILINTWLLSTSGFTLAQYSLFTTHF